MENPRITAALELARDRHRAIGAGDIEAYAALDEGLAAACAALTAAGVEGLTPGDTPAMDELIGLETQSRRLLEELMADASTRMAALRQNGRANGAYMRHEQASVTGA